MKPGDLVKDGDDGEIGLVVSIGPGIIVNDCEEYPDGCMPSWKVKWPSAPYVCDLGEDSMTSGLVKILSEA
tara:strand:- start:566 stop:778 length:213 start_codon:yes stop_codon:yes gene_type:complete